MNDAQLHNLLETTALHLGQRLDELFDLVDLVRVRVTDLAGRAAERRKPFDRTVLATIRPLLQDILRRDEPLLEGIGVAVDQNSLSDAPRWLEWWWRDNAEESHFMAHVLDPQAVGFYDYQSREWFVHPLADDHPRAIGPYVDSGGVDKYTVTLTIPAPLATGGRIVAGGDLCIAGLESYVLDQLGFRQPPVALVGNGRVIVSNSGRYVSGSRLQPQTTIHHTAAVHSARDEQLTWRLVALATP
ncbi:cache domain-containing protein [Mycobacterium sp. 155]|uniref:cache domain-containing protein n=1 Tax=Mycobacterium sp. 155 TaxID=1157943 RepID=UPI00037B93B9|nr:cache domain-containing protein [Mycobacterium sp. 155]